MNMKNNYEFIATETTTGYEFKFTRYSEFKPLHLEGGVWEVELDTDDDSILSLWLSSYDIREFFETFERRVG
jgi:hypothetical protein